MTLIVEIEEFLKDARSRDAAETRSDAIIVIHIAHPARGEPQPTVVICNASLTTPDEDELITWDDAAWQ